MRCKIRHYTRYTYSDEVIFSEQIIKLTPKQTRNVKVNSSKLKILPKPSLFYSYEETDGTISHIAFFDKQEASLTIDCVSDITITEYNPFNFLISPYEYSKIPFKMTNETHPDLMPYLHEIEPLSDDVKNFVYQLSNDVKDSSLDFATALCSKIREIVAYEMRSSQDIQRVNETFSKGKGSCRDMALAFMQICRLTGIPARYVSGYAIKEPDVPGENPDLHSWVDLYLPGAGWVAFDPTLGLIPGGTQVVLAASAIPKNTMPITGGYYGTATSKLEHLLTYTFLQFISMGAFCELFLLKPP